MIFFVIRAERWCAQNLARVAAVLLIVGIFGIGTIFAFYERGDLVDGWWWAFISSTTTGYGDFAPKTDGVRILTVVLILTGLICFAMLTAELASRLAVRRLHEEHEQTPHLGDDFDHAIFEAQDVVERLARLKHLYEVDEDGDNRIAKSAKEVTEAWRQGPVATREAVQRLEKVLEAHGDGTAG